MSIRRENALEHHLLDPRLRGDDVNVCCDVGMYKCVSVLDGELAYTAAWSNLDCTLRIYSIARRVS